MIFGLLMLFDTSDIHLGAFGCALVDEIGTVVGYFYRSDFPFCDSSCFCPVASREQDALVETVSWVVVSGDRGGETQ
jgi:hypothetical protein